jgi:dynein heavy chain
MDIQPKDGGGGGGGPSREEIVEAQCDNFLAKMPATFNMIQVKQQLSKMGGGGSALRPLEIHLKQEIDRMQVIIKLTKSTCDNLKLAIAGSVIMTPDLGAALNCIVDARVPPLWLKKSWSSPSLGLWFGNGLVDRTAELFKWVTTGRPKAYWLTGYFNPQGFLTSVQQEVTRRHNGWALDGVQLNTEVVSLEKEDADRKEALQEGVYIYGLFLEAAAWDKKGSKLVDAPPKKLFCPVPCIFVTAIDKKESAKYMHNQYLCPVYTIPSKTGLNFVFTANIKTEEPATKWTLRGTSMLCSKD